MYGYGIFTDITNRKKADIARNDFERRKTEFMSLASHELRTPLTLVKGYIDVLKKRFNDLSTDERNKCFLITERNIQRLENLISGVNELTKIERGIFTLNTKLIEFNSFLNDTLIAYQDLLGESLTYINPTQNLPCFIEIDSDRIAQVLDNIIQNAINHTAKFDRRIVIECDTQMRDVIKIRFRDNGAGIAQENLELIFTPFVSIPSKYSVQGTGIGLFLSKSIIENHNGLIYAESQGLDKGSIFTIELPKKSTYGLS
jgi:two-component system sensor histidine kinase VicK